MFCAKQIKILIFGGERDKSIPNISGNILTPNCNTVLVQCCLDAERKLVRTISDRIAHDEQQGARRIGIINMGQR